MAQNICRTCGQVTLAAPALAATARPPPAHPDLAEVPVLPQKSHALVSRTVRDMSLQSMMGVDVVAEEANDPDCQAAICPDDDQPADCEEAATAGAAVTPEDPVTMDVDGDDAATAATDPAVDASKALVSAVKKKRRLYRQLTGSEVPWFPHDNDTDLLRELVHEANVPSWVYFGTPAGGAGMHGCMEMGCSVMALCSNDHHRENLGPFLVQRAVEDMLGQNTLVFKNDTLSARAKQLHLMKDDQKKEIKIEIKTEEEEKDNEEKPKKKKNEEKEDKEGKKNGKTKKKKKKPPTSSESTANPDFDSSSVEDDKPPKKKKKTGNTSD